MVPPRHFVCGPEVFYTASFPVWGEVFLQWSAISSATQSVQLILAGMGMTSQVPMRHLPHCHLRFCCVRYRRRTGDAKVFFSGKKTRKTCRPFQNTCPRGVFPSIFFRQKLDKFVVTGDLSSACACLLQKQYPRSCIFTFAPNFFQSDRHWCPATVQGTRVSALCRCEWFSAVWSWMKPRQGKALPPPGDTLYYLSLTTGYSCLCDSCSLDNEKTPYFSGQWGVVFWWNIPGIILSGLAGGGMSPEEIQSEEGISPWMRISFGDIRDQCHHKAKRFISATFLESKRLLIRGCFGRFYVVKKEYTRSRSIESLYLHAGRSRIKIKIGRSRFIVCI